MRSTHDWTLQAVSKHQGQDLLSDPGHADLTAFVDFETLSETALSAGALPFGPVNQGSFLKALGIETRAKRLARDASPDQVAAIDAALERLTGPKEMGLHFKALALTHRGTDVPAGFEEGLADL